MKIPILSFFLTAIIATANAQTSLITSAIGDTSGTDYGYNLQPTADGNWLMAGKTSSFPPTADYLYSDGLISKLDLATNTLLWSKQYRLAVPQPDANYDRSDIFWNIKPANGNYIIAGTSGDTAALANLGPIMVKIDASGNPAWGRFLIGNGVAGQGYTCGYNAADDTYLLAGTILPPNSVQQAEAFVAKFDTDGNTIWIKTYGEVGSQVARSLIQVADGWLIAGVSTPQGSSNTDLMLLKINNNGILQWAKTYGGNFEDRINGACILNNGMLFLTGFASRASGSGNESLLAMSIDPASGAVNWAKSLGMSGSTVGNSATPRAGQANICVVGYTNSTGQGANDALIINLNMTDGAILSASTIGSTLPDQLNGVTFDATSGNYYAVGATAGSDLIQGNDAYLVKTGGAGVSCLSNSATFTPVNLAWMAVANTTINTNTGVNAKNYPYQAFAAPLTRKDACFTVAADEIKAKIAFTLAPNPSNGLFRVTLEQEATAAIYNNLGQLIATKNLQAGTNILDLQVYPNGIYTLRLSANDGSNAATQLVKF